MFYNGGFYNEDKLKSVFVFYNYAVLLGEIGKVRGFACVGIPATRLYIPSFIEIRLRVSEPQGVKIWPFPLTKPVAVNTGLALPRSL